MLPEFGQRLDSFDLPLTYVRDLEDFDGPLLTQYRGPDGSIYIEKWCSRDGAVDRWLLARSDLQAVAEYLAERATMMEMLTRSSGGVGFLVDKRRGERLSAYLVAFSNLPERYLPRPGAMHDRERAAREADAPVVHGTAGAVPAARAIAESKRKR